MGMELGVFFPVILLEVDAIGEFAANERRERERERERKWSGLGKRI